MSSVVLLTELGPEHLGLWMFLPNPLVSHASGFGQANHPKGSDSIGY